MSWIVSLPCTRAEAEALSGEIPALDAMPEAPVVVTREIDADAGLWHLDAYMDDRPGPALLKLLQSFVPSAKGKKPVVEELPEEDWVTLAQQGLDMAPVTVAHDRNGHRSARVTHVLRL